MASTLRATHQGTCQVCGHFQKLPLGRLAKHGYAVQWNQFVGTCYGSHELPFEEDCQLVVTAIANAETALAKVEARIAKLRTKSETAECLHRIYVSSENRHLRGYHTVKGRALIETHPVASLVYGVSEIKARFFVSGEGAEMKKHPLQTGYFGIDTEEALATMLNIEVADEIEQGEARGLRQYIKWQKERLAGWAPKPLTPVVEVEAVKKAASDERAAATAKRQVLAKAKRVLSNACDGWSGHLLTVADATPGFDKRGADREFFNQLYYSNPSPAHVENYGKKLDRMKPQTPQQEAVLGFARAFLLELLPLAAARKDAEAALK